MLKFVHKKHIQKEPGSKQFVVYYNASEIILGFLLVSLVGFFIYNYIQFSFQAPKVQTVNTSGMMQRPVKTFK